MLSASWRIEMWQENSRGTLNTLDVCLLGNMMIMMIINNNDDDTVNDSDDDNNNSNNNSNYNMNLL